MTTMTGRVPRRQSMHTALFLNAIALVGCAAGAGPEEPAGEPGLPVEVCDSALAKARSTASTDRRDAAAAAVTACSGTPNQSEAVQLAVEIFIAAGGAQFQMQVEGAMRIDDVSTPDAKPVVLQPLTAQGQPYRSLSYQSEVYAALEPLAVSVPSGSRRFSELFLVNLGAEWVEVKATAGTSVLGLDSGELTLTKREGSKWFDFKRSDGKSWAIDGFKSVTKGGQTFQRPPRVVVSGTNSVWDGVFARLSGGGTGETEENIVMVQKIREPGSRDPRNPLTLTAPLTAEVRGLSETRLDIGPGLFVSMPNVLTEEGLLVRSRGAGTLLVAHLYNPTESGE